MLRAGVLGKFEVEGCRVYKRALLQPPGSFAYRV